MTSAERIDDGVESPPLGEEYLKLYQSYALRLFHLAHDRADLQYDRKELTSDLSESSERSVATLKRCVGLFGSARLWFLFARRQVKRRRSL